MKQYTEEQITLWGQINMVVGCAAITAVHLIVLLLGVPPLDWVWQGILFVILVSVGYLYYRPYQKTKGESKGIIVSSDKTFEEAHRDAVKEIEEE